MGRAHRRFPLFLLIVYIVLFVLLAIHPYDRATWIAENIPIVLIVLLLVVTCRKHQFSNAAYIFLAIFPLLHTIGGHYTFERVPFGFVTDLFGFARNNFDRLAHFTVGFYAYGFAEILLVKRLTRSKWVLVLFPIFAIFTVASCYEIIEWLYAALSNPQASSAFLGSQGDVWDAQKDMLADGLGAITAMVIFSITHYRAMRENETGLHPPG